MTARRLGLLLGLAALAALGPRWAFAVDKYDHLIPNTGTQPVALTGGDTPSTYSVSCSSNTLAAGATLLIAAVNAGPPLATESAGRPLRKRCFLNTGSTAVVLGSSTVAAADYFQLTALTGAVPEYCTQNSGAYYCAPATGNTAQTVVVIQETQSVP